MESENKILTFIKAIDKQFFNNFINDGQVCMNTVKWFRDYEKQDSNVGDKFEGVRMACGKDFTVRFADPIKSYSSKEDLKRQLDSANWLELGKGVDLKMFYDSDNANIFSLYAITSHALDEKSGNYLVPKKFIDEFSNHRFVIFIDPMTFLSRMNIAISKLGKTMKSGMVQYYKLDENLVEDLGYFHKPARLSYQNEFRIVFEDEKAVQQIFNIGSTNEICIEIDINQKFILEPTDNDHFLIKMLTNNNPRSPSS